MEAGEWQCFDGGSSFGCVGAVGGPLVAATGWCSAGTDDPLAVSGGSSFNGTLLFVPNVPVDSIDTRLSSVVAPPPRSGPSLAVLQMADATDDMFVETASPFEVFVSRMRTKRVSIDPARGVVYVEPPYCTKGCDLWPPNVLVHD